MHLSYKCSFYLLASCKTLIMRGLFVPHGEGTGAKAAVTVKRCFKKSSPIWAGKKKIRRSVILCCGAYIVEMQKGSGFYTPKTHYIKYTKL